MRDTFLPFALPDVDDAELLQIKEALDSGWVTTGPKTQQFEAEFAAAVGAKHAVAVNSCTAAMHLALEAIGLRPGDEVITTPYTFAATAEVVRYFDAKPGAGGRGPPLPEHRPSPDRGRHQPAHQGHHPGPHRRPAGRDGRHRRHRRQTRPRRRRRRRPRLSHQLQRPHDRLRRLCSGTHQASFILPHFTCFSFYATKTLTTGEGGMITTDDDALAERCRIMALHGISKDAWKRYTAEGSWYYEIIAPGYKYNMTDIAAGMGLAQLAKAERMALRRREIAQRFTHAFGNLPQLQVPHDRSDCQHAWHLYMLRLNLDQLRIDRARFIEAIEATPHRRQRAFYPAASAPLLPRDLWLSAGGFSGRLPRIPTRDLPAHLQQDERPAMCRT